MPQHELVDVKCKFLKETEKAVLIEVDGDEAWIPKSQVDDAYAEGSSLVFSWDELERGDAITIVIPEWLAEDKGLI